MTSINLFWFRRDLRLEDNIGLYHALKAGLPVLPLFIFDQDILKGLEDKNDQRVSFIYDEVSRLKEEIEKRGGSLLVKYGRPESVLKELGPSYNISNVFTNHDYEPYSRKRDDQVKKTMAASRIGFNSFKDQVIFEKEEVVKDSGMPYTVFTPYSKKWKGLYQLTGSASCHSERLTANFHKTFPFPMPRLEEIGFRKNFLPIPPRKINTELIRDYHLSRNFPSIQGTSKLSIHLRFGTISIRKLVKIASEINETFLNELIWREFYMMILWHFPRVVLHSFKPEYDRIPWRSDERDFKAWCNGQTGYPIVDAGMRELNQTGFMHNRVRMITASFLTKHLLTDWRWGEAYFAKKLLDYESSSNNGGWQWAAGTGCDAAPYFRVFNPAIQADRFDPEKIYIQHWIPELMTSNYPIPIVDHTFARNRAIEVYKSALRRF